MTESHGYEFDTALSFAGEDRDYVEEVATALKAAGMTIFLDSDYLAEMWGEDLIEFFDGVYRKRSRYAVLFLSRAYAEKMWTREERRSALARAMEENAAYVLPIRLDATEIPGIRPTVSYLDARRVGIDGIVAALSAKLAGIPGGADNWPGNRTPRTAREVAQVLATRPPAWEYLYWAGTLLLERDALEPKYRDHELRFAARNADWVGMDEALEYLQGALSEIGTSVGAFTHLFDPSVQERAFGRPGESGDAERIRQLAFRMTSAYERLMDWAAHLRGVRRPSDLNDLFELLARFADTPISEYRAFVDHVVEQTDTVPAALAAGGPVVVNLVLTLSLDDDVMAAFTTEMHRVFGE